MFTWLGNIFSISNTGAKNMTAIQKSGTPYSGNKGMLPPGYASSHASGGWVGLNGPELSWVGEKGPEYITPTNRLGSTGGGGGSPLHVHFNLIYPPSPQQARAIAETVSDQLGRKFALMGGSSMFPAGG
jgi:hypothetical protein